MNQIHKKSSTKNDNTPVSKVQMQNSIEYIKKKLPVNYLALQHAMIAHHVKRAHVYRVCCGSTETPDMLKRYIASFNDDSKQGYAMNRLLSEWFIAIFLFKR